MKQAAEDGHLKWGSKNLEAVQHSAESKSQLQTEVLIELCLRGWNGYAHVLELLEQRISSRGSSRPLMWTILKLLWTTTSRVERVNWAANEQGGVVQKRTRLKEVMEKLQKKAVQTSESAADRLCLLQETLLEKTKWLPGYYELHPTRDLSREGRQNLFNTKR